jgi:hypothetical protein
MKKHGRAKNKWFSYLVKITAHGPEPLRKNGFFLLNSLFYNFTD